MEFCESYGSYNSCYLTNLLLHSLNNSTAPKYTPKYNVNYLLTKEAVSKAEQAILKADTGSSKTYLQLKHACFLHALTELFHGPKATLPNGSIIQATQQGNYLPLLPDMSLPAYVFPHLQSESL